MLQRALKGVILFAAALVMGAGDIATGQGAQPGGSGCSAEQGQRRIYEGRYKDAVREFTCVIEAHPTAVEGYRGRIEAQLLLGQFSNAVRDYARVTALVEPVHPDASKTIFGGYATRLSADPTDVPALTGASFARWWYFDYAAALHLLNRLLAVRPNDLYGTLFRGSTSLLHHTSRGDGIADLENAIALAPKSPDVRYVVSDAYTYGLPDPRRALREATLALAWGLDTPRVHAILAAALNSLGDRLSAAQHIYTHIDMVTSELIPAAPLAEGESVTVNLAAGRTFEIPLEVTAGETLSILTSTHDFYDSILVLLAPDGTPVLGADDYLFYFAGFEWMAEQTGTYRMLVTSFEAVNTGELYVSRQ